MKWFQLVSGLLLSALQSAKVPQAQFIHPLAQRAIEIAEGLTDQSGQPLEGPIKLETAITLTCRAMDHTNDVIAAQAKKDKVTRGPLFDAVDQSKLATAISAAVDTANALQHGVTVIGEVAKPHTGTEALLAGHRI